MSVDVCIDRKEFVPLGGPDLRRFFHWDVEIPLGKYSVAARVNPTNPLDTSQYNNPFPTVNLDLPPQAVDPSHPRSIWRRGLDHKLHAEGGSPQDPEIIPQDPGIIIRSVYYRKLSDPDLMLISNTDKLYRITTASCVDLFTVGYPPATFAQLAGNDYCLGRCKQPAIYNSGD